jgi:hypothetical protein
VGSNLLQEIRKGQVEDKKIQEIKRNIKEEKSPSFLDGVLSYKERVCVPSINELKDRYFMKHMSLLIPFIQEGIRCTVISRLLIGGMKWRETLSSMLLFATLVSESRLNIND